MSNILNIAAYLKFIEFVLHRVSDEKADNSKTIAELKIEFKENFHTDLTNLINQNFGIIRLLPLLFIREEYKKYIDIIRHAIAHGNFSINDDGYEFKSDKGILKLSYKEFLIYIHKIENEYVGVTFLL